MSQYVQSCCMDTNHWRGTTVPTYAKKSLEIYKVCCFYCLWKLCEATPGVYYTNIHLKDSLSYVHKQIKQTQVFVCVCVVYTNSQGVTKLDDYQTNVIDGTVSNKAIMGHFPHHYAIKHKLSYVLKARGTAACLLY